MLQEIYISNFVLIEELRIDFSEGLNVLSGETGAGKSIIIDALGLIMGERVKNDWIRDSNRKAIAEAVFILPPHHEALVFLINKNLIEEKEDTLIISREIYPGGRSLARINGRNVTASLLKELAALLLDMHLQHEHLSILKAGNYLEYLDSFGEGVPALLADVEKLYSELKRCQDKLNDIEQGQQDKLEKLDLLHYQIQEIESANLHEGEKEELEVIRERIKNSVRLLEGTDRILHLLYSNDADKSAYDLISAALDTMNNLKAEDFFITLSNCLEEIYYNLQDIAMKLASFREQLDFQPGQLEEIEDRLYLISRLQKKYGENIKDILDYLEQARFEYQKLSQEKESKEELQALLMQLLKDYRAKAEELTKIRFTAAKKLQEKVNDELLQLNMPYVKFAVSLQARTQPAPNGLDEVDFLFSPNPGEPLKPLSRIASGGELSRFVLALKTVLAGVYKVPTMIFDEIDVGVGGSSLTAMARKLSQIAANHQVILVTHSAQVASYAQTHYLIEKKIQDGRTFTQVKLLDEKAREQEIARMLSGDKISPLTLEHAREMLLQAQN